MSVAQSEVLSDSNHCSCMLRLTLRGNTESSPSWWKMLASTAVALATAKLGPWRKAELSLSPLRLRARKEGTSGRPRLSAACGRIGAAIGQLSVSDAGQRQWMKVGHAGTHR